MQLGGAAGQAQRTTPSVDQDHGQAGRTATADSHAALAEQAVYSPDNVGHFGLAYESYTHFTSPIRRYPDLLVHRAIKAVAAWQAHIPPATGRAGGHCSQTERRADEATRDVECWLKCYYMQDKVGESFDGIISGVTAFGLSSLSIRFTWKDWSISPSCRSDYFHFDPVKRMLLGERTGRRYRLGDRIRVKLVRVDLEASKIDFVLAE